MLLPGFGEQVRVVACYPHKALVRKGRDSFQEALSAGKETGWL